MKSRLSWLVWSVAFAPAFSEGLTLRDLPDELQRGDPAVRALAVFGQLLGRQLKIKDLAKEFLRLSISEKQVRAVDD